MKIKNWFRRTKPSNRLNQALLYIKDFKLDSFDGVYSSDIALITIVSIKPNIVSYTKLLKKLNGALLEDRIVYRVELPDDVYTMSVSDFFLDDNNYYLDSVDVGTDFFKQVKDLLNKYDEIERSDKRTFNSNKNLMVIQTVINNLIDISEILCREL